MTKELKFLITFSIFLFLLVLCSKLYTEKVKADEKINKEVSETIEKINNDKAINVYNLSNYIDKINILFEKNLYTLKKDKKILESINDDLEKNINNGKISKINL